MKKIGTFLTSGLLSILAAASGASIVHAQITPQSISNNIGTTLKNAVNATKESAAKNSSLRNQLVSDNSADLANKEKNLNDQLTLTLSSLENIQTRIAAKTAETAASGTDTDTVNAWLASSSQDITLSQAYITAFASSTFEASSGQQISIAQARRLADRAIREVNAAHDDLQSALDALTSIL